MIDLKIYFAGKVSLASVGVDPEAGTLTLNFAGEDVQEDLEEARETLYRDGMLNGLVSEDTVELEEDFDSETESDEESHPWDFVEPEEIIPEPFELNAVLDSVVSELTLASSKFPAFHSPHEGFAILKEEVDELWTEVKANDRERAREEAIQVAAMALRFLLDC